MKSAPLLLASCLGCKTTVESSRENNGRAGALIHPSACMLGDLGLTPITYHEGGGGEGGGGMWAGAKETAVFSQCITLVALFLSVKPLPSPSLLPTIIVWSFTLFHSICGAHSLCLCFNLCKLIRPTLSLHCLSSSSPASLYTFCLPIPSSLSFSASFVNLYLYL